MLKHLCGYVIINRNFIQYIIMNNTIQKVASNIKICGIETSSLITGHPSLESDIELARKFVDYITPTDDGTIPYRDYSFRQFVVSCSALKEKCDKIYGNIGVEEVVKIFAFAKKVHLPLFTLVFDIMQNVAIVKKKLMFATGKVAQHMLKFYGYTIRQKSSLLDKSRCTIVYYPPKGKQFSLVVSNREDGGFQYDVLYKDMMHLKMVQDSPIWKQYPEKMLRWANIRQFAILERPEFRDMEAFEVEEQCDHLADKLPNSYCEDVSLLEDTPV